MFSGETEKKTSFQGPGIYICMDLPTATCLPFHLPRGIGNFVSWKIQVLYVHMQINSVGILTLPDKEKKDYSLPLRVFWFPRPKGWF